MAGQAKPRVTVMILAGGEGQRLHPLTSEVAKPGVRFGGCYRMIDFALSNCINSGLRRIHLLTQYASTSLTRHVRRAWAMRLCDDFDEFVDFVPPQRLFADRWYAGTADAIFQNIFILQEERPEAVVLLSGDHAYKMDYSPMLAYHEAKQAELTIATLPLPREKARGLGTLRVAEDGQVVEFLEKPADPPGLPDRPELSLVNMGVYVWQTRVLVEAVVADARTRSSHDFGRDVIPALVAEGRAVYAYEFRNPTGGGPPYWRDIGTLDSYWEAHMDLVAPIPQLDLYDPAWPIYTDKPPLPPAKIIYGEAYRIADVRDSLLSPGCIVSGAMIERSVLSPNVRVETGAEVSESVLMDGVIVGAGARLRRVIVDEGVRIPPGFQIGFDREADSRRFVVTAEGVTVVPRRVLLE